MSVQITRALLTAGLLVGVGTGSALAAEGTPAPSVQLHGYMQNRFYIPEAGNMQFRTERVSVSALGTLANTSNAYVELYYHPALASSALYVESAYYDLPFADGRLRVGKGRRTTFGITPAYPNRKTSNYGLVGEAITQDRISGAQYTLRKGILDLGLSGHVGFRLGSRAIGEVPGDDIGNTALAGPTPATPARVGHAVPHLSLRDMPGAMSRKLQFSGRVGVNMPYGLRAGLSGSFGDLAPRDLASLRGTDNALRPTNPLTGEVGAPIGASFTSKDMNQYGLDVSYKHQSGILGQAEWYRSGVSDLDYDVWNALVGYEIPTGWRFTARYSQQLMDIAPTNNPLTWDTRQLSLAVAQPLGLGKSVWLQYEYENNTEKSNTGASVKNDVFFVELFSGF